MENNLSTAKQKNLTTNQPKFAVWMNSENVKRAVERACGKNSQSFMSSVISAVTTNPGLNEVVKAGNHDTLLSAALLGESLKLSPSPQLGQYFIVPFNDKRRGYVGQFVMGYKGMIQLALRTKEYKRIIAVPVKEGEFITWTLILKN